MDDVKETYRRELQTMGIEKLMDELSLSVRQNRYGSHDEQISMVRSEISGRVGGN